MLTGQNTAEPATVRIAGTASALKNASGIEIPASITGVPFYLKMGYHYKNGITEPDEEHLIRMEKNR